LYDQRPAPLDHQGLDGGPLIISQNRLGPGQLFEDRLSLLAGCHGPIMPGSTDIIHHANGSIAETEGALSNPLKNKTVSTAAKHR
jgi:hypothetical protein